MTFAARTLGYLSAAKGATLPASIATTGTSTVGVGAAQAGVYINTDNSAASLPGKFTVWSNDLGTTVNSTWLTGGGSGANYDVRFDLISGTLSAAPFASDVANTWLTGSSTYLWGVRRMITSGTNIVTGTLSIRDASTLTVLATSSVTLTANLNP